VRDPVQSLDLEIERRLVLVRMHELQHMLAPIAGFQMKDAVTLRIELLRLRRDAIEVAREAFGVGRREVGPRDVEEFYRSGFC
jgi:hypothetical protein